MTSGSGKRWSICGTVLAIPLVVAGSAGCVGFTGVDSDLLASLGLPPGLLIEEGGNVVISCVNGTQAPVQWRLTWQQAGSEEESTFAVTIESGKTKTLSVEGGVERIAAGSLAGWSVAAIVDPSGLDPHTVSYGGGPLENGVDFQSGDIIRFSISPSGDGKYLITAEIARGG